MREYLKFYIDGQWVDPSEPKTLDVDNPTTEQVSGKIAIGSAADVDKAVKAARKAFATWSVSTREERLDLLQAIAAEYQKRSGDLADAVHEEMGAPPVAGSRPPGDDGHGSPDGRHRRVEELLLRGAARDDADRQGADRRLRPDHAVELADQPDRLQGVPGAGHRLHDGAEAVGGGALFGTDLHRGDGRGGRARRRVQHGVRRRSRCRRGDLQPSRHRPGVLHRFDPRRRRRREERGRHRQAGHPGARRQEPEHRHRRREVRRKRRRGREHHDGQLRPEL